MNKAVQAVLLDNFWNKQLEGVSAEQGVFVMWKGQVGCSILYTNYLKIKKFLIRRFQE